MNGQKIFRKIEAKNVHYFVVRRSELTIWTQNFEGMMNAHSSELMTGQRTWDSSFEGPKNAV